MPGTQVPFPLQVDPGVSMPPAGQLAGAQVVPGGWKAQAPAPSQVPSVPQELAAVLRQVPEGSGAWAARGVQVPSAPATAQDEQVPQAAAPQHTPSTQ